MHEIDKRTQKIRDRIYIEIEKILAAKNKEKPNLENTNNKIHKIY